MLVVVNSSASAADRDEGTATDSVGFMNTFSLPTGSMDLDRELASRITYPAKTVAQGIEGEVVVLFTVDVEGKVSEVDILKDIGGDCALEVAQALRKMKFQPVVKNGYPRPFAMPVSVQFSLK